MTEKEVTGKIGSKLWGGTPEKKKGPKVDKQVDPQIEEINKKSLKALEGLEPKILWKRFYEISRIPRESSNEKEIRDYLKNYAKTEGLKCHEDEIGNVIIKIPASKGLESKPGVILQAHCDMVCEKEKNYDFDFAKLPILLVRKDDWLSSHKTTLGGDNGIGLAIMLAIADERGNFQHGKIELLVTVAEETGLYGAFGLDAKNLEGTMLINLDSEDWEEVFIGCAGGGSSTLRKDVVEQENEFSKSYLIEVAGLQGGHSGCDIHLGRANCCKIFVQILNKFLADKTEFTVGKIEVISKYNAIPREGEIIVNTNDDFKKIQTLVKIVEEKIMHVYGSVDPDISIKVTETKLCGTQFEKEFFASILDALTLIPHGVQRMSYDVENVVETSNNLATISVEISESRQKKKSTKVMKIGTMYRSLVGSEVYRIRGVVSTVGKVLGMSVVESEAYPGWKPQPKSDLLDVTVKLFNEMYRKLPKVKVIHAGLETGIIKEKCGELDGISFGPTILNAHTPKEKADVVSTKKCYEFTKKLLTILAK